MTPATIRPPVCAGCSRAYAAGLERRGTATGATAVTLESRRRAGAHRAARRWSSTRKKGEAAIALGLQTTLRTRARAVRRQGAGRRAAGRAGTALRCCRRRAGSSSPAEGAALGSGRRSAAWLRIATQRVQRLADQRLPPGASATGTPCCSCSRRRAMRLTAAYAQIKELAPRPRTARIPRRRRSRAIGDRRALGDLPQRRRHRARFLAARLDYCGYIPRDESAALRRRCDAHDASTRFAARSHAVARGWPRPSSRPCRPIRAQTALNLGR